MPAPESNAPDTAALVPAPAHASAASAQVPFDFSGFTFVADPSAQGAPTQPGGSDAMYYQPFPQPGAWDFNYS